jgi:hypothetical protein
MRESLHLQVIDLGFPSGWRNDGRTLQIRPWFLGVTRAGESHVAVERGSNLLLECRLRRFPSKSTDAIHAIRAPSIHPARDPITVAIIGISPLTNGRVINCFEQAQTDQLWPHPHRGQNIANRFTRCRAHLYTPRQQRPRAVLLDVGGNEADSALRFNTWSGLILQLRAQ